MPFVSARRPSLQIGLLKALAEAAGFTTDALHLNLPFASALAPDLYERLCEHRGPLVGEWLFSIAAFGDEAPDPDGARFLDTFAGSYEHLVPHDPARARSTLLQIRRRDIPRYLDRLLDEITWSRYRVVGFTSTFQQQVASLALARRLKARHPTITIVFGGANLDGGMGVEHMRAAPWIDYAVAGEADETWPALLRALAGGRAPGGLAGLIARRDGRVTVGPPAAPTVSLDALPIPDYSEFFERAEELGLLTPAERGQVPLPFESARGCWWGERQHCTFCGLNGTTMAYRNKSPERLLGELKELSARHDSRRLEAVDNILAPAYLETVFPVLAAGGAPYELFFEVKASLTPEELGLLRRAGVASIQPGIESLSTRVLKLMRKGTSALQNVNVLRWCLHHGIDANWNLLWGFPRETRDDYDAQLALLKWLVHLQPPHGGFRIWMERFSPIFADRLGFPARVRRPEASYAAVYPAGVDLEAVAYFFDYVLEDTLPDEVYGPTAEHVKRWRAAWASSDVPSLTAWRSADLLRIEDRRDASRPMDYTFDGFLAALHEAASARPTSVAALARRLETAATNVEEGVALLCSLGLVARDGSQVLALAVPAPSRPPAT